MKVVKILFALITMAQTAASGQIIDTCNCKLLFGDWYNPTMVIYHHDSFVTYFHSISPKDTVFKLIKGIKEKDTIFNPSFYNWIKKNTMIINNGELGSKINGTFYPRHLSGIQFKEKVHNYYWLDKDHYTLLNKDSADNLYSVIITYEEPIKINDFLSNCFTIDDPYYLNQSSQIQFLNREELLNVPYFEFLQTNDTLAFVRYETYLIINRGSTKYCYIKGVGEIEINKPYPERLKVPIIFLTPDCNEFFKRQFKYELIKMK